MKALCSLCNQLATHAVKAATIKLKDRNGKGEAPLADFGLVSMPDRLVKFQHIEAETQRVSALHAG